MKDSLRLFWEARPDFFPGTVLLIGSLLFLWFLGTLGYHVS